MANEEKTLNRPLLCVQIALCGAILLFLTYLTAGILPPVTVDYRGSQAICLEADMDTSDAGAVRVTLSDTGMAVDAPGISILDSNVRITKPGTYRLTGSLTDGCIYIAAESGGNVHLILDGVSITGRKSPPVYVSAADKVTVTLADGSDNAITATVGKGLESAIYSQNDITFNGSGHLTVVSESGIAVNGRANVRFAGGSYEIRARENAIKGKHGVYVTDGDLTLVSMTDAIRTTGTGKACGRWIGNACLEGGTVTIRCNGDAVNSNSIISIHGGSLNITCGRGTVVPDESVTGETAGKARGSAKGLRADTGILIAGGDVQISSMDDAINSNGDVTITDGTVTLYADDDAIHADKSVNIRGGEVRIERCSEGIEGHHITLYGGRVVITASDDAVNATAGKNPISKLGARMETELLGTGGRLSIRGGTLQATAFGDGLDVNGSIVQSGGNVLVVCRASGPEVPVDYNGEYRMTGGELIALGRSWDMLRNITAEKSTVGSLNAGVSISLGSTVTVSDGVGTEYLSFVSEYAGSVLVLASEKLERGTDITLSVDGTAVGSVTLTDKTAEIGDVQDSRRRGGMKGMKSVSRAKC